MPHPLPATSKTLPCRLPACSSSGLKQHAEKDYLWLQHTQVTLQEASPLQYISWAAYHASQQNMPASRAICPTALLPLLLENAHTVAMIKHSMNVVRDVVEHLNPGQTPMVTFDKPLFALAKQIQWKWPQEYGEGKFVVLFGGLHIEHLRPLVTGYKGADECKDWFRQRSLALGKRTPFCGHPMSVEPGGLIKLQQQPSPPCSSTPTTITLSDWVTHATSSWSSTIGRYLPPVPLLCDCPATGGDGPSVRALSGPSVVFGLRRCLERTSSVVSCSGSHQLRALDSCEFSRHGGTAEDTP